MTSLRKISPVSVQFSPTDWQLNRDSEKSEEQCCENGL